MLLGQTTFVQKQMVEYLMNNCDKIEFLCSSFNYNTNLRPQLPIFNFVGESKYAQTDFWNMKGTIMTFPITKEIKNYFINIGSLETVIPTLDNNYLENLTLYQGSKLLFSTCTHEGYVHIDESIKPNMEQYYIKMVNKDSVFDFVKSRYLELKEMGNFDLNEIQILKDLNNYIAQHKNAIIFINPVFECDEKRFLSLTKKYMPDYIVPYFNMLNKFENFDIFLCNIPEDFYNIIFYYQNILEFL